MRLYLSKGRIWTGTQADAKAAQGSTAYETIDVPDAKAERMAWLNAQWARLLGDKPDPEPAPVAAPVQPVATHPEAPEGMEWRLALKTQFGGTGFKSQWQPGENDCLCCHRTRKGAASMGQIMAKDDIADALWSLTDPHHLDDLEGLIAERRRELGLAPKPAPALAPDQAPQDADTPAPLPAPRVRTRVRVAAPEGAIHNVTAVHLDGERIA